MSYIQHLISTILYLFCQARCTAHISTPHFVLPIPYLISYIPQLSRYSISFISLPIVHLSIPYAMFYISFLIFCIPHSCNASCFLCSFLYPPYSLSLDRHILRSMYIGNLSKYISIFTSYDTEINNFHNRLIVTHDIRCDGCLV